MYPYNDKRFYFVRTYAIIRAIVARSTIPLQQGRWIKVGLISKTCRPGNSEQLIPPLSLRLVSNYWRPNLIKRIPQGARLEEVIMKLQKKNKNCVTNPMLWVPIRIVSKRRF